MNNYSLLKALSWTLFALWLVVFAAGGYWFAFIHHNDAIGHQYGLAFIIVMVSVRLVIMVIDKVADSI